MRSGRGQLGPRNEPVGVIGCVLVRLVVVVPSSSDGVAIVVVVKEEDPIVAAVPSVVARFIPGLSEEGNLPCVLSTCCSARTSVVVGKVMVDLM